ncbi:hypothetical protein F4779DRAFT_611076 [Xylariaceae sp. FL0662B]|nr:hypothetical protein F4779DRAFT_611076 [Xylariaceae sp. FL0662B]
MGIVMMAWKFIQDWCHEVKAASGKPFGSKHNAQTTPVTGKPASGEAVQLTQQPAYQQNSNKSHHTSEGQNLSLHPREASSTKPIAIPRSSSQVPPPPTRAKKLPKPADPDPHVKREPDKTTDAALADGTRTTGVQIPTIRIESDHAAKDNAPRHIRWKGAPTGEDASNCAVRRGKEDAEDYKIRQKKNTPPLGGQKDTASPPAWWQMRRLTEEEKKAILEEALPPCTLEKREAPPLPPQHRSPREAHIEASEGSHTTPTEVHRDWPALPPHRPRSIVIESDLDKFLKSNASTDVPGTPECKKQGEGQNAHPKHVGDAEVDDAELGAILASQDALSRRKKAEMSKLLEQGQQTDFRPYMKRDTEYPECTEDLAGYIVDQQGTDDMYLPVLPGSGAIFKKLLEEP